MQLPNRLFFTGCPGSRWSGIAQDLEHLDGVNISDHSPTREYNHGQFSGHKGSYFGAGMEFSAELEHIPAAKIQQRLDEPWADKGGMKILKSHEWAFQLPLIKKGFPDDWIMLVYRPTRESYTWWIQAGGFNITYPSYAVFKDYDAIFDQIVEQNKAILNFGFEHNVTWHHYSNKWVEDTFGQSVPDVKPCDNILVTVIK